MSDSLAPLSHTQEGLWLVEQVTSEAEPVYNESLAYVIDGPLDIAALREALAGVVARHEALRTTIEETPDGLRAVVHEHAPGGQDILQVVDLSDEADPDRAHDLADGAVQESYRRPFDLVRGPLVRGVIARVSPHKVLFGLTAHHIIVDGWSLGLVLDEIGTRYAALTGGRPALSLPAAPAYTAYARRQRDLVAQGAYDAHIAAWKELLENRPQLLKLPTDRPRPATQTHRGATRRLLVPRERLQPLFDLGASACGSTDFAVLLSVHALLMSRLSGQDEVTIGTTLLNRPELDDLSTVGCFVNTAALPFSLQDEDLTFRTLLDRTVTSLTGVLDLQEAPYTKVLDALDVPRDPSHHPVFQTMLTMLGQPKQLRLGSGLVTRPHRVERVAGKFDLLLYVSDDGEALEFEAEFNTDLFDPLTVERYLRRFVLTAESLAGHFDEEVQRLPVLLAEERELIRGAWNDTARNYPGTTVVDEIEAQVRRTPNAVAVAFGDESLTYAELDARAERVALALRRRTGSDGPAQVSDGFVGVYMERSLDMVVALWAVVKAGLAYVPIDPDYPSDRVKYMIEDSAAPLVLTQEKFRAALEEAGVRSATLVDLIATAEQADGPLRRDIVADSRVYMIYTSGSTGRPKGVINRHVSLHNRLSWMQEQYPLAAGDRVLQKTPFSFDVSVWEFFWPLMVGATIVVAEPGGHRDPEYLASLIQTCQVTTVHFVPSMLNIFLEQEDLAKTCDSLRRVFCSGEALPHGTVTAFTARLDCELHNLYGPTEAAIDVSYWQADPGYPGRVVPIGRPIANTHLYIVDRDLRLQPIGVPGELCIGGVNLAEGYHNRPDLTAAAFVEGPFDDVPDGRLYRTGDLARFLPDGNIEYLGRIDNQVKLHGLRIELGEIEAAIRQLPGVREAAVVLHEHAGTQGLVAYVAATGFEPQRAVKDLKGQLPDFMVPQRYVEIPSIPLSANGKLDRKALPDPLSPAGVVTSTGPTASAVSQGPATASERAVARAWQEVLAVRDIDVDATFFQLGGDSIQAIRVASRLRESGYHVAVKDVFNHLTVRRLAARLDDMAGQAAKDIDAEAAAQSLVPFCALGASDRAELPAEAADAWPLTRLQAGMVYHSMLHEGSSVYHDVFSYDIRAPWRPDVLRAAVGAVTARHGQLRSYVDLAGYSEPVQIVVDRLEPCLEVTDLGHLTPAEQDAELTRWTEQERRRDFDLEHGPLVRFRAVHRSEGRFTLSISFHHAVLDGWSVALIIGQIRAAYEAGLVGGRTDTTGQERAPLPYSAYVLLEQQALAGREHSAFWASVVGGRSATLIAQGVPAGTETRPVSADRVVPAEVAAALRTFADAHGVPVKSVYLTLHLHALARLTGRRDALTGAVVNGRPEVDGGELTSGLFLNTVPFAGTAVETGWGDAVRETFTAEQRMLAHRRYPLSEILRETRQDGAGGDLFDTVFNFTDFHVLDPARGRDAAPPEVTIAGAVYFEQTNFPFVVHVARDAFTREMTLTVNHDEAAVDDRTVARYLDEFEGAARAVAGGHVPPRPSTPAGADTLTETIAGVVAEVLGAESVEPQDDFVGLGLDSISAIRVVARIRRAGVKVALADVVAHPTAAGLAARVRSQEGTGGDAESVGGPDRRKPFALAGRPRETFPADIVDAYPATAVQVEMIRRFEADPGQAVYHDVFGYRLALRLDHKLLHACVQQLVDRHETLRTGFDLSSAEPLQLVHDRVTADVPLVDLATMGAAEQQDAYDRWFEAEKATGFDWDRPSLMRFTAHRLSDGEFILSLSFHHSIIDGWSLSLLIQEFVETYTAAAGHGRSAETRPATLPYRFYAAQESADRKSAAARDFWAGYLRGASAMPLPFAPVEHETPGPRWNETKFTVDPAVHASLSALARRWGTSLKPVLLAAHVAVLSRLHHEDTVLTHVFAGGRLDEDGGDETLGMFLNFTPLYVTVGERPWADLVKEIVDHDHRILPHRRYPLPDIERDLGVPLLAPTAFNYTRFSGYGEVARRDVLRGVQWFEHTHFPVLVNAGHDIHQESVVVTLNADARKVSPRHLTDLVELYRTVLDEMATGKSDR
ncbi:non-ribosomal peptide synthetase [Streptomyces sp. SID4946]|uniref:non-ribosomal peptide synthetase n=1 Tax=Streptomyces sp. LamerLS-31b TaxID=1839765 RepID=UPI00081ECC18|nr:MULTISPECIES: non-ribosomal peptide synthetase [unclassified Streptomyces]MYQ93988.1 non-ribosomal peptide synthetase [Streptomyces sp. SID4946]SCF83726.1 amino acid adenylation domain-containing protein [Streptomyces sp. LamerLS-31b]SCF85923.1 amino acid adenylation domain-containing protein [Streptomyces sp. DconLS]